MKFLKLVAFFALLLSINVNAACLDCKDSEPSVEAVLPQKIYLQNQQIAFLESKIYVNLDSGLYVVPAIYSDEQGYFILARQPRGRCEPYEWKCGKCGTCNEFSDYYCVQCGREMQ